MVISRGMTFPKESKEEFSMQIMPLSLRLYDTSHQKTNLIVAPVVLARQREDAASAARNLTTPVEERAGRLGNLLIPQDAPRLLRFLNIDVPTGTNPPLTEEQWMAKHMKAAISHPLQPTGRGFLNGFTQDDIDTIKAATGYNFVVMDGTTTVLDDDGNPPPYEVSKIIMKLADRIETDRSLGLLVGDITESYLRGVFKDFEKNGKPFPEEWLKCGLAHVRERDTHRPAAVRRSISV
ncbi:hypothetical protein [Sphingomonas sp. BK345]|uniref:hypothetical protein n=1 Tax=Sphingomonas sp. BK345 TaxID=2586980 RepID=UPI0016210EB7|nr:hypothetical protein [Sphingomonas sp. BK345]MBB3474348.1 hypothetical protein [Sphingomonas sp. BK345]